MKLTFDRIEIINFKCYPNKVIDFKDGYNEFIGFNGVGKTTILDAITWCMFGKDFTDKTQFQISPIIGGVYREDLFPMVKLIITVKDNQGMTNTYEVERSRNERGLTNLRVNTIKYSVKEYNTFLIEKLGISDEEFKTLSNIGYAIELDQNKLRKLIMDLIGDIRVDEILKEEKYSKEISLIKEKLKLCDTQQLKKDILESKSKYQNEKISLKAKIEQENMYIKSYNLDEERINSLKARKEQLETINNDYQKNVDIENKKREKINEKTIALKELELSVDSLSLKYNKLVEDGKRITQEIKEESDFEKIKKIDIEKVKSKIDEEKFKKERLECRIELISNEMNDVANKFNAEKEKAIIIEDDICHSCGQKLPQDKLDEILKFKAQEQKGKLLSLKAEYDDLKKQVDDKKQKVEEVNKKIEDLQKELLEINKKDYETLCSSENESIKLLQEKLNNKRKECLDVKEEYNKATEKVKILVKEIELLPQPISINQENVYTELETINSSLENYYVLQTHKENLDKLMKQMEENNKKLSLLELSELQLKKFINIKSEILNQKLSNEFNYIQFKTSELTKDGKEIECFKVVVNGKEYGKSLSGGEKMKASLDLITTIQKLKNKNVPLLIDSIGELDQIPDFVNSQTISCRTVSKPSKYVIKDGEKIDNPNFDRQINTYSSVVQR